MRVLVIPTGMSSLDLFYWLCETILVYESGPQKFPDGFGQKGYGFRHDVVYCLNYLHRIDQPKFLLWMSRRYHVGIPRHLRAYCRELAVRREESLQRRDCR